MFNYDMQNNMNSDKCDTGVLFFLLLNMKKKLRIVHVFEKWREMNS